MGGLSYVLTYRESWYKFVNRTYYRAQAQLEGGLALLSCVMALVVTVKCGVLAPLQQGRCRSSLNTYAIAINMRCAVVHKPGVMVDRVKQDVSD